MIFETIVTAFRNVKANKVRAFLTMIGIIIGIISVIVIMSLGAGLNLLFLDKLKAFNTNTINIFATNISVLENKINDDDINAIYQMNNIETVIPVNAVPNTSTRLLNSDNLKVASLFGVDHRYSMIEELTYLYGRPISENDNINESYVCVISKNVAEEIFGYYDAVGKKIDVTTNAGIQSFTVIGVYNLDAGGFALRNPSRTALAFIPISVCKTIKDEGDTYDSLAIIPNPKANGVELSLKIREYLERIHNNKDGYYALSAKNEMEKITNMLNGLTMFVAFVAFISLFVGGVGVMNIMLVSVTERTREIGIQKSLGASRFRILFMFLVEALIISLTAGFLGVLLGIYISQLSANIITNQFNENLTAVIEPISLIISFSTAMIIGIVFGVYPASKASKLNIIDALRYE